MVEQKELFHCVIKGFSISRAFAAIDTLFESGYLSASCAEDDDGWLVEIIHTEPVDVDCVRELLSLDHSCVIVSEEMPKVDWLKKSFENFKPVTVGSFYMYGPHLRGRPVPINKIGIEIAAATAFGTGTHPTTSRCLVAIETYLDPARHMNFLDVGCGSGILSIAAAKLGMRNIVACDNQAEAVRISKENVVINNVAHRIKIFQNKSVEFADKSYDFVVSNILASPLIEMREHIFRALNPGGTLVLAGFTSDDPSVERAYSEFGMTLLHKYEHEGWTALVYRNM